MTGCTSLDGCFVLRSCCRKRDEHRKCCTKQKTSHKMTIMQGARMAAHEISASLRRYWPCQVQWDSLNSFASICKGVEREGSNPPAPPRGTAVLPGRAARGLPHPRSCKGVERVQILAGVPPQYYFKNAAPGRFRKRLQI